MTNRLYILFALLLCTFVSCSVAPQKIDYGKDACHSCKMAIVDKTHASEIVTKKGKAFKYDAIECMVRNLSAFEEQSVALHLVANYLEAGVLLDATQATYIISDNIRSPMGANLSALETRSAAEQLQKEQGGDLFSWDELRLKFGNPAP